jgi:hypothetical protein
MDKVLGAIGAVVVVVVIVAIVCLLMGYPTMWLMNYLFAPTALQAVFGIAQMTFWKAFWLNILAGILIKSTSASWDKS